VRRQTEAGGRFNDTPGSLLSKSRSIKPQLGPWTTASASASSRPARERQVIAESRIARFRRWNSRGILESQKIFSALLDIAPDQARIGVSEMRKNARALQRRL